ncbi:hypothetical protein YC2023_079033 [Brassica napus]
MWNFKSMTYDDPMKFGFGSPGIKDKKKKKKKRRRRRRYSRLCNSSKYMKTTSNSPNISQKSNRAFRTEPEHLREHAKEETNAISYEPGVEKTLRRNTSSNPFRYTRNHTEITHSPICFMVILA